MEIICSIILSFILMTKPGHFEVYYKYVLFFAVLLCTLHILIHNSLANVLPLAGCACNLAPLAHHAVLSNTGCF